MTMFKKTIEAIDKEIAKLNALKDKLKTELTVKEVAQDGTEA